MVPGVPRLSEAAAPRIDAIITEDIAVARRFPIWRDPDLPAGWSLYDAETGTISAPAPDGYRARYVNEGYLAATIHVYHRTLRPYHMWASNHPRGSVRETRLIDGHPAFVQYAPPGHEQSLGTQVWIFHRDTGLVYVVRGQDPILLDSNIDRTIEIARSLYRTTTP